MIAVIAYSRLKYNTNQILAEIYSHAVLCLIGEDLK